MGMNCKFKRFNFIFLLIILLIFYVINAATIAIDATKTYQTIDGFGACSAWISSKITASLATQFWQEDTIDGHIGLSILRTRIDPSGSPGSDSAAMKKAIQVNPKMMIWSAAWTPPSKLKTNGSAVGGSLKSDSASQQGYADFLVKYVQDVKKKVGVDLYAVSCQNEPDFNPSYEGCQWSGDQFRVFVRDFWGPACKAAGITAKRMISESYRNSLTVSDPSLKDAEAAAYVDIIGEHLYGGGPNPYPLADSLKKQYWETENSGMSGPNENITDGIMYANKVHNCLVKCNMNAYHYWWLVNNNNDDEGLCNSSGKPTPRMFTIGNFSKFIRPGFVRIDATASPAASITASAYCGASYGRLVIVAINAGAEAKQDFSIQGFSGEKATPWITDATRNLVRQDPIAVSNNAFSFSLPSKSVVTFVLWDGKTIPPPPVSVKSNKNPSAKAGRLAYGSGGLWVEVAFDDKPWTMQIVTLSGQELCMKRFAAGMRRVFIAMPSHAGAMLVRTRQGSVTRTSLLSCQQN
jgi:glucuronoarabinoxylan endo-1,4-beta-xylanase